MAVPGAQAGATCIYTSLIVTARYNIRNICKYSQRLTLMRQARGVLVCGAKAGWPPRKVR